MQDSRSVKHKFPYQWKLSDGYPAKGIEPNGLKVFGTFICGGGSTMGYKLAGFDHLGGVEIDKKVAAVYQKNHNPKYLYVEDIREFNNRTDLPDELYSLDILDGSPPYSSFSVSGNREKDWVKEKQFAEGQAFQRLDDLVFEYIATIKKLQPKVAILENVKGLIIGNAKAYVKKMAEKINEAGYDYQLFLLNAASMGVPQKRERVFFICRRKNLNLPAINLHFDEPPIPIGNFCDMKGEPISEHMRMRWAHRSENDINLAKAAVRGGFKYTCFNQHFLKKDLPSNTLIAAGEKMLIHYDKPIHASKNEFIQIGSFPFDYDFENVGFGFLVGMSVPPVMTAQISHQIFLQIFNK